MEYNTYIAEATEEGYNKGHEKGIEQNNIDVAKKMLEEKLPLETISKITGLSTEEVLKLK